MTIRHLNLLSVLIVMLCGFNAAQAQENVAAGEATASVIIGYDPFSLVILTTL